MGRVMVSSRVCEGGCLSVAGACIGGSLECFPTSFVQAGISNASGGLCDGNLDCFKLNVCIARDSS